MTSGQPPLRMPLTTEVALVPLDTAGAVLGLHIDAATAAVESGEWPFVFDLGAGRGEVRELRVWRPCLTGDGRCASLRNDPHGLRDVITDCIGTQSGDVRGAALEARWRISNRTLKRLLQRGDLRGRIARRTLWFSRESLVEFLVKRRVL